MLLKINERGTWTDPPPVASKDFEKQDEEIFQTARLVKYVNDLLKKFLSLSLMGAQAAVISWQ